MTKLIDYYDVEIGKPCMWGDRSGMIIITARVWTV